MGERNERGSTYCNIEEFCMILFFSSILIMGILIYNGALDTSDNKAKNQIHQSNTTVPKVITPKAQ